MLCRPFERNYGAGVRAQSIQIVRPRLHHLPAFRKVRCAVVGASVGVTYRMGQLVLDVVRLEMQGFVQDRTGHCPEPVPAHFVLIEAHAPQRR